MCTRSEGCKRKAGERSTQGKAVFRHIAHPAQLLHIWIFFFHVFPPFFGFSAGDCIANASLLFCFFPFFFCGTRRKVLRLLRSWIKHMNMTKSLVTSVSLHWVLASWSQTRHVLFMSQRILSVSLHFYWLLIPSVSEQEWLAKEAGHKGWIANSACTQR